VNEQDSLIKTKKVLREEEAVKLLEGLGYSVVAGETKTSLVITNQNVIDFFYGRLSEVADDSTVISNRLSENRELKAVKKFQEKALKENLSKNSANESLMDLIDLVFTYYDALNLNDPPYSISFLVSEKGSWIFTKALKAHKDAVESYEDSEEAEEYKRAKYNDMDEDETFKKLRELRHKELLKGED